MHYIIFDTLQGSASVYQKKGESEEPVEVGKLGPSDYFGMKTFVIHIRVA